jgi:hypothetical protein
MAITPLIKIWDYDNTDAAADIVTIQALITAMTFNHVYGWSIEPLSNSRTRYTLIYD